MNFLFFFVLLLISTTTTAPSSNICGIKSLITTKFFIQRRRQNSQSSGTRIIKIENSAESMTSNAKSASPKYDAVIIPGGGLESGTNLPNPWVRERLDAAVRLSSETRYFIVLSRGTTHRPSPLDDRGFPISEAAASAKYIIYSSKNQQDVIETCRILVEGTSLDTIGNAFFTRVNICDPMRLKKFVVVTSKFHMPRTKVIFDWIFGLDHDYNSSDIHIEYMETEDIGMSNEQKDGRGEREKESLKKLIKITVPTYNTMEKVSQFLFQQHSAYNAHGVTTYETTVNTNTNTNNNNTNNINNNLGKEETVDTITTSTY